MVNDPVSARSSPRRINETSTTVSTAAVLSLSMPSILMSSTAWYRPDELVRSLVQNMPKPPLDFYFSKRQRQQQTHLFRLLQDLIVPPNNANVYNADIINVCKYFISLWQIHFSISYLGPDKCSELFRHLIESLLITHAECKLNDIGHLDYENFDPNSALHSSWCANLTDCLLP